MLLQEMDAIRLQMLLEGCNCTCAVIFGGSRLREQAAEDRGVDPDDGSEPGESDVETIHTVSFNFSGRTVPVTLLTSRRPS